MTLNEAVTARRSRRSYLPVPVAQDTAEQLQALAQELSRLTGGRMEPVFENEEAFKGFRKSYGLLTGVRNYVGIIADRSDAKTVERLGFYGELLALRMTALGLGTCWVGGSFDRGLCPFTLGENESILCTIAFGNVQESDSLREKVLRGVIMRKTKTIREMVVNDGPVPDWFVSGMKAVQKAPSAVNRQPVLFSYQNGIVTAGIVKDGEVAMLLDFGIAKLHFLLGANRGAWGFGNHAAFDPKGSTALPGEGMTA